MGCDVSVVTDDGTCYWSDIQFAKDFGHCVIYLNHGTTEEPGMIKMTGYLRDNYPQLKVETFPAQVRYKNCPGLDLKNGISLIPTGREDEYGTEQKTDSKKV